MDPMVNLTVELRDLLALLPDGVAVHCDGEVLLANYRMAELLGLPPETELTGRLVRELVPADTARAVETELASLAPFEVGTGRRRVQGADGEVRIVESRAKRIQFGGRPAVAVVARDVTAQARAEDVREATNARLRYAIAAMAEGVTVRDAAGALVASNPAAAQILGLTAEQLAGVVPPPPGWRALGEDGEPLRDGEGRVTGWLSVGRDVTAQAAARRALQASEARHRASEGNLGAVLDGVPDAVVVHRDGTVIFANPAAACLYGFERPADLVGKDVAHSIDPRDRAQLAEDIERAKAGEVVVRRRRVLGSDERIVVVESHSRQVQFEGAPATVAVVRDLTEFDRVQQALLASEAQLRSIFTAMAEGVVLVGADGRIRSCNAAAERILGLSQAQMESRASVDPAWRTIREDGSPFPGEAQPAMVTLRTGEPQSKVVMGVHQPSGALRWISISSEPLRTQPDAPPDAVVATFVDVTEERQATAALREAIANVKVLSGFLPICMFCKNIRDDAGYWQRLEKYIGAHSDVSFSHGLCPECAREHYPDDT